VPLFARWRPLATLPARRGRDAQPGVYELADDAKRTIYVGQSGRDVPNRIRQHLAAGGCVADRAAYWRTTYSATPKADEAEALAAYAERHGGLPPCNRATQVVRSADRRLAERLRSDD
jgi:predicted GIY-YIG superfamily endonuclease